MPKHPQNKPIQKKAKQSSPSQSLRDTWLKKLQEEEKVNKKSRDNSRKVVTRYRDETRKEGAQFNILWANEQVLTGALYSSTPKPDVRRRFLDSDTVSRETSSIIERALSYSIDSYDFDGTAGSVLNDYLLPGYGQARIRYKPYFEKVEPFPVEVIQNENGFVDQTGEEVDKKEIQTIDQQDPQTGEITKQIVVFRDEQKVYEEVTCEAVPWDRFRWEPGKTRWEDVTWAAIDYYLTKEELEDQFGEISGKVEFTHGPPNSKADAEKNLALVHEIFDKRKRQVIVVSEGFKDGVMQQWDDPLNLVGFYPFPKPLFATQTTGDLMPLPDFHFYQDQAIELDDITARIDALVNMLKVRGVYDQSFKELVGVLHSDDGEMTPVKDFAARFGGDRDLKAVLSFMPIDDVAKVLTGLYNQREAVKQTIYEITGIADIVRGQTNAAETLGAQQLKGRFADMRLSTRRKKVDTFFRDILRIKSEIISENFSNDTLKVMTGSDITPEINQILKSDVLRAYKIDIETESTMAIDADEEQKSRSQALGALTLFLEKAMPAVQAGLMPKELAKELSLFVIRGFKRGRPLEDILERLGSENQDENSPEKLQQAMSQLKEQNQQLQQQIQQGSQIVQQLQDELKSKQIEESAKTQRENEKSNADIVQTREKIDAEERTKQEERIHEESMQKRELKFQLLKTLVVENMKTTEQDNSEIKLDEITQVIDNLVLENRESIDAILNKFLDLSPPSAIDIERDESGKMIKLVPDFGTLQ